MTPVRSIDRGRAARRSRPSGLVGIVDGSTATSRRRPPAGPPVPAHRGPSRLRLRGPDGTPLGYGHAGRSGGSARSPSATRSWGRSSSPTGRRPARGATAIWTPGHAGELLATLLRAGLRVDGFPLTLCWTGRSPTSRAIADLAWAPAAGAARGPGGAGGAGRGDCDGVGASRGRVPDVPAVGADAACGRAGRIAA